MKLCSDCKHFTPLRSAGFYPIRETCDRHLDPVYGNPNGIPRGMREPGGSCGPEAKLFEPKPAPPRPWWKFWG